MARRRPGQGSVYQRADGRWFAQIRVYDESTGASRKVRKSAATKTRANELLKEMQGTVTRVDNRNITVADYLSRWAATTLAVSPRADATKAMYASLITSPIRPTMAKVRLEKLTPLEVERWLVRLDAFRKRNEQPLSANTKQRCYTVLRLAMDTAVRDGLLAANPVAEVAKPRVPAPEVRSMTPDEVDKYIAAAWKEEQWGPLAVVMANTALRISEALALRWDAVDLDAQTMVIRKSKTDAGKRIVPMVDSVVLALRAQKRWQARMRLQVGSGYRRSGLVFTTAAGGPLDAHNARRAQRRILTAAGLETDRPWHTLRHSLATRLLRQGVPMPVVSAILGHASIRTTVDIYGHFESPISATDLQKAMESERKAN